MKLNWCADEGPPFMCSAGPFKILLAITIVFQVVYQTLSTIWYSSHRDSTYDYQADDKDVIYYLSTWTSRAFLIFSIYLIAKTRKHVRKRYDIRETQCNGCEDICCASFCGCCVIGQLARHTTDYEVYPGTCCSDTGVSSASDAPDLPPFV